VARYLIPFLVALFSGESPERADLTLPIETWYKVVQGTRPAGYVHEILKRAAPPWRYEYALETEFELTLHGKPHVEDLVATAFLDDALSPVEFTSEGHVGESSSTMSMITLGDERRVEVRAADSALPISWVRPAGDDLLILPTLALYLLRQNESLSRPGRITGRTLDPQGQEKDGLPVDLEAGHPLRRSYLGKEATVIPVTFLRPFPAAARETGLREAFVDRFGRIVEATLMQGSRILIASDRTEALEGLGLLHRHGRRDPFDKSAALRNAALERARSARGELELPRPPVTLDSLDSDLTAAVKRIDEIRTQRSSGDLEEARRSYLQAVLLLKAVRELALLRRPELVPQIEQARDDAEAAWDGAAQVEREAGRVFVQVRELVDRLDLPGLEHLQKELALLRDRVEVERRPERERIVAWVVETDAVLLKCRTRLELAQARLDVTGITMGDKATVEMVDARVSIAGHLVGALVPIPVVRPFAMATINGRLVTRGDLIEGTPIRVRGISPMGVQLSLRDEVRDVGFRR